MYFLIGVRRPAKGETESQARGLGDSQEKEKKKRTAKTKETNKQTKKTLAATKTECGFCLKR